MIFPKTRFLVVAFFISLQTTASAQMEDSVQLMSDYVFAMPVQWTILSSGARKDDKLLFRRFSVVFHKSEVEAVQRGKLEKPTMIGKVGTFSNSMIFSCVRDRRKVDFVTFHLPEKFTPASFQKDTWISKIEGRVLADGTSFRLWMEYIKGDLFLDANAIGSMTDFLRVLDASEIIVEFGDKNDRLNLFIGDNLGKSQVGPYIREVLPLVLGTPGKQRFMSTAELLATCINYKRTGSY